MSVRIIILHGPKAWCMVSCTTPESQSECRDSRSTSTKGNNTLPYPPFGMKMAKTQIVGFSVKRFIEFPSFD